MYFIASLKHTSKRHEHITFWGPNYRGYVLVIKDGHTGQYSAEFIGGCLNDGESSIAVPVEAVKALASPQSYFACGGKVVKFYDTPGPAVENTRANWNALIAASMVEHRAFKPKPEVFRGARRSFAIEGVTP